jgi:hypothetical protein
MSIAERSATKVAKPPSCIGMGVALAGTGMVTVEKQKPYQSPAMTHHERRTTGGRVRAVSGEPIII